MMKNTGSLLLFTILFVLAFFIAGIFYAVDIPLSQPVLAKGIVKTQPSDKSDDKNKEDKKKEDSEKSNQRKDSNSSEQSQKSNDSSSSQNKPDTPKQSEQPASNVTPPTNSQNNSSEQSGTSNNSTSQTKPDTPRQPEPQTPRQTVSPPARQTNPENRGSSSGNLNNIINQRDEKRVNNREEKADSTPERRGSGTPDIRGQIEKRSESRDPDYKHRTHRYDAYKHFPNDNDWIIITPQPYEGYLPSQYRIPEDRFYPQSGSLEEALIDIKAAWLEEDPELFMWHIDRGGVEILRNGRYYDTLSFGEMLNHTEEMMDRTRIIGFRFTDVEKNRYPVKAKASHRFVDIYGRESNLKLIYELRKNSDGWFISSIDTREDDLGSPKCFIATAAFGTPMAEEVIVLRKFRDHYLLKNKPGKLFVAAYYKISPPIARQIKGRESARFAVRMMLKPLVQLCKFAGSKTDN